MIKRQFRSVGVERGVALDSEPKVARYPLIGLVGSLASGKTTLKDLIGMHWNVPTYKVLLFEEHYPANPYLEKFYREPEKYCFDSEMFFLRSKIDQLRQINSQLSQAAVVVDPALQMDYIFAMAQLKMGWMKENEFYWYTGEYLRLKEENHIMDPDIYAVVYADPNIVRERVRQRGRPFEQKVLETHPEYFDYLGELVYDFWRRNNGRDTAVFKIDSGRSDFVNTPQGRSGVVSDVGNWIAYCMDSRRMDGKGMDGSPLILPKFI